MAENDQDRKAFSKEEYELWLNDFFKPDSHIRYMAKKVHLATVNDDDICQEVAFRYLKKYPYENRPDITRNEMGKLLTTITQNYINDLIKTNHPTGSLDDGTTPEIPDSSEHETARTNTGNNHSEIDAEKVRNSYFCFLLYMSKKVSPLDWTKYVLGRLYPLTGKKINVDIGEVSVGWDLINSSDWLNFSDEKIAEILHLEASSVKANRSTIGKTLNDEIIKLVHDENSEKIIPVVFSMPINFYLSQTSADKTHWSDEQSEKDLFYRWLLYRTFIAIQNRWKKLAAKLNQKVENLDKDQLVSTVEKFFKSSKNKLNNKEN